MNEFIKLEEDAPATLINVLQAVVALSEMDVTEVSQLTSQGRLREFFPYRARIPEVPPDSVPEHLLQRASAMPLTRRQRRDLIQASMPASRRVTDANTMSEQEQVLTIADLAEMHSNWEK
jgi:hypothetical protein